MLVFFTNLSLVKFLVRYLAILFYFFTFFYFSNFFYTALSGFRWEVFTREYPINSGVLQGFILDFKLFLLSLMTFLMMLSVILLSILMILISKCDQASDLWQQLELAAELELELQDTGLGQEVAFWLKMLEKLNLFCLIGLIAPKRCYWWENWRVNSWKIIFQVARVVFLFELDWGSYIISIARTPRKLEPWFVLWSFFFMRLLCIFISLPCRLAWCIATAGAPSCYLEMLDKLLKRICTTGSLSFAASLEPLARVEM